MRFSIAVKGAGVSKDIGCCDTFLIFEEKQGKIIMRQNIESPGQQAKLLPGFLEKFKIEAILCGAMDTPVRLAFNDQGISVITGLSGNADKLPRDLCWRRPAAAAIAATHRYHWGSENMIVDELINRALSMVHSRRVQDIRAGLGYTCVMLEGGGCGLAYTFRNELGNCCGILDAAGSLIGRKADEIIPWAKANNRLKAAVGLAAINAVINDPGKNWPTGNVLTAFTLDETDTFGMVGAFHPILSKVKTMTKNIYVFEQNAPEGSGLYPAETMPLYLPRCDVIVITATSIINHTVDGVLSYCQHAKEVCLVGPSTPLCPEVFREHHITLLAGSVVKNPELLLQIVSQGGGTMAMKPAVGQVLVRT